jgi:hypothetical protein
MISYDDTQDQHPDAEHIAGSIWSDLDITNHSRDPDSHGSCCCRDIAKDMVS